MSLPEVVGTPGRIYQRYLKAARIQLHAHRPQLSKHPRKADGTFAPKSEMWVREDGQEKHLPHFLGDDEVELSLENPSNAYANLLRLEREAKSVIVAIAAIFCAALWCLFGWGFTGAMVILLSVFFVWRLFQEPRI